MHSKHACQVGPLINQEIFLGCTKGRVRVTEEIVMQQQGNDDRDGDDASYDTCMLMMTDVNVLHASIRYGNRKAHEYKLYLEAFRVGPDCTRRVDCTRQLHYSDDWELYLGAVELS